MSCALLTQDENVLYLSVNTDELIRKIKKTGRRDRVSVEVLRHYPKGGHVTIRYGERRATLPMHGSRKELATGTLAKILKDLGLPKSDLA